MSLKKCIGLVSVAVLGSALAVGCSSKSDGTPSTPETDAGTSKDTGTVARDTGVVTPGDDDDTSDSGATACVPADETGFKATWHKNLAKQTVCTAAQIASYGKCLDNQSDATLCGSWNGTLTAANKKCLDCMKTPSTAAAYGAVILKGNVLQPNVAGCIAVATNDPDGTGCAGKFQAGSQCTAEACTANCPVDANHPNGIDDLNACITTAETGTCAPFVSTCNQDFVDGTPEAACNGAGAKTFGDYIAVISTVMCLGDSDASTPPADAAAE
jgi:hypothetical protein